MRKKLLYGALALSGLLTVLQPLTGSVVHKMAASIFLVLCVGHMIACRKKLTGAGVGLLVLLLAAFATGVPALMQGGMAGVLTGRNRGWSGRVTVGGIPLDKIAEESLLAKVTYVGHQSTLFKGTVGDNLRMGNPKADDAALWQVLEEVRLADFLRSEQGLDTPVAERGANLSGGQCQRLALARAILHDSPVYIFDEATSNIDVESENVIMDRIRAMAGRKTVILISHRLDNLEPADRIYVMQNGRVVEAGTHGELLERRGVYARLWNAQQKLENLCEEETQ